MSVCLSGPKVDSWAEEDMARGLVSGNQLMIQKNKNNNLIVQGDPSQLPMEDLTVFNGDLEL